MNQEELIKFSNEGGIGTCIAKIDVEGGKDLLPCKIGDIITILKPLNGSIYLGTIAEKIGHFNLEDVNVIYLNLVSASPARNKEKYLSFTALLEQDIPTGTFKSDSTPLSIPQPSLILPSTEDSMEDMDSIDSNTKNDSLASPSLDLKIKLSQHRSLPDFNNSESPRSKYMNSPLNPNYNSSNGTLPSVSVVDTRSTDITPTSTVYHREGSKSNGKGFFSGIRSLRSKAADYVTSAKVDPSLVLLKSGKTDITGLNEFRKGGSMSSTTFKNMALHSKKDGHLLQVDAYGFITGMSDDEDDSKSTITSVSDNPSRDFQFDLTKEGKWYTITKSWSSRKARKSYRVKKLVEAGVPEAVRAKVWPYLSGADIKFQPNVYQQMLTRDPTPIYDVIERDIRRTYPTHALFYHDESEGQLQLHRILQAYAQYNPEVGYCQGMGMLVGLMLMQGLNEESAFWLLVATIGNYLQGYFTPTLSQLRVHAAVFEYLLNEHDPKLSKHLINNDVTPLLYVTPWFLTVYTTTLPWASVLRVWDLFYYKGVKILFRIGLAILTCVRPYLLQHCPTSAELMPYILHIPHDQLTPEKLMKAYRTINLTTEHIQNLCQRVSDPDGKVADRGALKVK